MAATATSDTPAAQTPRRPITPADLCRFRSVSDVALHPSGDSIVHVVSWPDEASDANRAVLYTCGLDGSDRHRLTEGHRDTAPRFSPDGDQLAFIRSESKQPTRVMLADWPVGDLTEVAGWADDVDDVQWTGDGRLVVLAARRPDDQEGVDDEELARRPRILDRIDYRFNGRGWTHDRPGQVFVIDDPAAGTPPREIGMTGIDHRGIAPSPDGSRVAVVAASDEDRDLTGVDHIWLLPIEDGAGEPIRLTGAGGSWATPLWHPGGMLVGLGSTDISRTGFARPYRLSLPDDGPVPSVELLNDADQHVVPGMHAGRAAVAVTDGILFPGVRRGRVAIDRHGLDGEVGTVHQGDHQVVAFDATADGSVVVAAITSPRRPAELWRVDGEPTRLVSLNDDLLGRLDLAPVDEIAVTSSDGARVHGFVVRPPETAPTGGSDGRRPGLVYVHGGPMAQFGLGFFDEFQMAAALGYVVVAGNPRGSDGYGEEWATAPIGDLGNRDWLDVSALADHLGGLPEVDESRLGIGGGSYGGFMTGWALSHDRRFKAGLIERAVTSWTTMYGTSDIGNWFTARTIGATLDDDPVEVRRQSPLEHAAAIEAPVLIVHSEEDWRCPIEQGEQLFAAIRRNGGDAIMVRFPGENHELSRSGKPSHRIERFEIVHEFFARHLGGADLDTTHLPR